MTRSKLIDDLWDYLDGQLDDERTAEIETALQGDADLRETLEEIRAHHKILSRTGEDVLKEDVPARLKRIVENGRLSRKKNIH